MKWKTHCANGDNARMPWASFFCFIAVAISALAVISNPVGAVPAFPGIIEVVQPDGQGFEARLVGDEWRHLWQTVDGYVIAVNEETGYWEYASVDTNWEPCLSGARVGIDAPCPDAHESVIVQKAPPAEFLEEGGLGARTSLATDQSVRGERRCLLPSTGQVNVPVILVTFSDVGPTFSRDSFDRLLFGHAPREATGPGSARDYFLEASGGALDLGGGLSGTSGWYRARGPHDHYGHLWGTVAAADLVKEAVIAAARGGMDFSQYDNDGDGHVETVVVVHAGRGAEESGNTTDIWSHSWSLTAAEIEPLRVNGVIIDNYIVIPELFGSNKEMTGIGVFCHELGHAFGLPDLYDEYMFSVGVGQWCTMGDGSWNGIHRIGDCPAHMSAWCRCQLGWTEPHLVRGHVEVPAIRAAAAGSDVYQLLYNVGGPWEPGSTYNWGDYFLVENRFPQGFDSALPGAGLAIWHIQERYNYNHSYHSRLVDLEEADGRDDLDKNVNLGDAGDLYPGTSNAREFSVRTYPNSMRDDGARTGVKVGGIGNPGLVMSAAFSSNFACLCSGYDDYTGILESMGEDWFDLRRGPWVSSYEDLLQFLGAFSTLIIDMPTGAKYIDNVPIGPIIGEYVLQGGVLLATDWSYELVQGAFPNHVKFLGDDPRIGVGRQRVAATVDDRSLANYIDTEALTLYFDSDYWAVIDEVDPSVEVLARADVLVDPTNPIRPKGVDVGDLLPRKPVAISFDYGQGGVIYTSHSPGKQGAGGEAVVGGDGDCGDDQGRQFAEWTVLRALLHPGNARFRGMLEERDYAVIEEFVGVADSAGCWLEIHNSVSGFLAVAAATNGEPANVAICDPEGRVAGSAQIGGQTCFVEIPMACAGTWSVHLEPAGSLAGGCDDPDQEKACAFVVRVGYKSAGFSEPGDGEVKVGPVPAGDLLNVYYNLDETAKIIVFDVAGRSLFDAELPAGSDGHYQWPLVSRDGSRLANGLYLVAVVDGSGRVVAMTKIVVSR